MEILGGEIIRNETTKGARGGTELMAERIASLPKEVLEPYQIIFSRVRDLDPTKHRLLYLHDLPGDPESTKALSGDAWKRFHKLIFVSNWQMQQYIQAYNLPWSKCMVMKNAIEPFQPHKKPEGPLRLAYWSTPHRGLDVLLMAFSELEKKHDIELHLYSSFSLYGWDARDAEYQQLFEFAEKHPRITSHGALLQEQLRTELESAHILAYPSTWPETSCLVLMEAMSAGMLCVHSNFAALYETSANWTTMYQFSENPQEHAGALYTYLGASIEDYWSEGTQSRIAVQKTYADVFYNWQIRSEQWNSFLQSDILLEPVDLPQDSGQYFTVRT